MSERITQFSERLDMGMNEKGIKASELAKITGISEGTISNYRSGRFKAAQTNLQKLAEALDVSIAWLMGYDVPPGEYDAPPTKSKTEITMQKYLSLPEEQRGIVEQLIDALSQK